MVRDSPEARSTAVRVLVDTYFLDADATELLAELGLLAPTAASPAEASFATLSAAYKHLCTRADIFWRNRDTVRTTSDCNSAKRDRPPDKEWMPWLVERSEQLIGSHHPLRETLIKQLGKDANERYQTLVRRYNKATADLQPWMPPHLPGQ